MLQIYENLLYLAVNYNVLVPQHWMNIVNILKKMPHLKDVFNRSKLTNQRLRKQYKFSKGYVTDTKHIIELLLRTMRLRQRRLYLNGIFPIAFYRIKPST